MTTERTLARRILSQMENDGLIAIHNNRVQWTYDTTVDVRMTFTGDELGSLVDIAFGIPRKDADV